MKKLFHNTLGSSRSWPYLARGYIFVILIFFDDSGVGSFYQFYIISQVSIVTASVALFLQNLIGIVKLSFRGHRYLWLD